MTVTAKDILEAKAHRYERLCPKTDTHVVVVLTLRMPIGIQQTPLAEGFFHHVKGQLQTLYPDHPWQSEHCAAGWAAWMQSDQPAMPLKKKMMFLETHHPLGACLDLDVLTHEGPLKRHLFGEPLRVCHLCDQPALYCQRENRHTSEALHQHLTAALKDYLTHALLAGVRHALLEEVHLHPKFGLVTPYTNGIHQDMTFAHFKASIEALETPFKAFLELPIEQATSPHLKALGLAAEAAMLEATQGVNTHKGAIFLLGWLLPYLQEGIVQGEPLEVIFSRIQKAAFEPLKLELDRAQHDAQTTGEKMYERFGILGARGEVMSGFKSLRMFDLQAYAKAKRFVALMSVCDDTTVLKRHSLRTLKRIQQDAHALLFEWRPATYERLSQQYLEEGISPGGVADLYTVWTLLSLCAPWLKHSLETSHAPQASHPTH